MPLYDHFSSAVSVISLVFISHPLGSKVSAGYHTTLLLQRDIVYIFLYICIIAIAFLYRKKESYSALQMLRLKIPSVISK